jgi:hypothetical protein
VEINISHNSNKIVSNYTMGLHAFVAMGTMQKVNIDKVNGMCAHRSREANN